MASEISWRGTVSAVTDYVTIRNVSRQYWNTSGTPAFETLTVANWANYAIALTETPSASYLYVGTWPSTLSTSGFYWLDVFRQAGGNAAIGDQLIGTLLGYWDGTTFKPWADDTTQLGGTAQTGRDVGLALPAAAPQAAGGLITSAAGSLDIDDMAADVDATETRVTLALPNAAPQAAGGLITSTAGSLDMDDLAADVDATETRVTLALPAAAPGGAGGLAEVGSAMTLTSAERDAISNALLDLANSIEAGLPVRGALRLIASACAGKSSGFPGATASYRNAVADTKARITATVDADGNRTAIVWDIT